MLAMVADQEGGELLMGKHGSLRGTSRARCELNVQDV